MANITGWGRGTWGQLTWGEPLPVTLTAPGAATSALGTVAVDAEANVVPASLVGTTGAPVAGVNGQAIAVCPSAVATLGAVSVEVDGEANVYPSGLAATSAIGTATTISNNNLSVTLNAATGSAEANVYPVGQSATGSVGKLMIWSLINEDQTSRFENITETQTPDWNDVAA
mgnify:CR=1 FL=1